MLDKGRMVGIINRSNIQCLRDFAQMRLMSPEDLVVRSSALEESGHAVR